MEKQPYLLLQDSIHLVSQQLSTDGMSILDSILRHMFSYLNNAELLSLAS